MRTETKKFNVYSFDELSDEAKEAARDKWREFSTIEDFDYVIEDATTVGAIIGIDIDKIYFSGFCSQGDGACFEGSYAYKKGSLKALEAYAPQDSELKNIALELYKLQRKYFYKITANVSHRGNYYHERCTDINVYRGLNDNEGFYSDEYAPTELHDEIAELLREFMQWIYSRLDKENDWINSDEYIDDNIKANDYEFNEDGSFYN